MNALKPAIFLPVGKKNSNLHHPLPTFCAAELISARVVTTTVTGIGRLLEQLLGDRMAFTVLHETVPVAPALDGTCHPFTDGC